MIDVHELIREYCGELAVVLWDRDVPPEFMAYHVNDWLPGNDRLFVEVWEDRVVSTRPVVFWLGDRWYLPETYDAMSCEKLHRESGALADMWRRRYYPPGMPVASTSHQQRVDRDKAAIARCLAEGTTAAR